MKKILLTFVAVASIMMIGMGTAEAAVTTFTIDPVADVNTLGTMVDVSGTISCTAVVGGTQTVSVQLVQDSGTRQQTGSTLVVCDGTAHTFALTTIQSGALPMHTGTASYTAIARGSSGTAIQTGTVTLV